MVCLDRETGPVHPSVCSAAPSTGRSGMSLSVTTRTIPPPCVLGVQRISTSWMRTHCTIVVAQSEDKQPGADLNRTRLGEWEGSVSRALPPQAFVPVCASLVTCACSLRDTRRAWGHTRQDKPDPVSTILSGSAQFLAVCSSSILAKTLYLSPPFSYQFR